MVKTLIRTENEAKELAEELVSEFAEKHKDALEKNRKNGDSFGATGGIPLFKEIRQLREYYLNNVAIAITETTTYFNMAIVKYILLKN